jgi:hypothetical protein
MAQFAPMIGLADLAIRLTASRRRALAYALACGARVNESRHAMPQAQSLKWQPGLEPRTHVRGMRSTERDPAVASQA